MFVAIVHPRAPVGWPHHGRYTSLKKPYFTYYCGVHGCVIVEAPIGWWSYRQIWIVHQRTGFDGSEGSQPEDLAVGRIRRRMGNLIHSIEFLSTRRQTLTIEVDKNLCDIYRKYYPRSCGKLQCIVYNVWLRDHNCPEFPPLVSPFTWVLVPQPRNGKSSHLI